MGIASVLPCTAQTNRGEFVAFVEVVRLFWKLVEVWLISWATVSALRLMDFA